MVRVPLPYQQVRPLVSLQIAMFDHTKFSVKLSIDKVTRVPYSAGHVFVRWNVTESPRPDAHGRTVNRAIDQSVANFDYKTSFNQRIGTRSPSRELKPCTVKFEILWSPEGNHDISLGVLSLNLAEFATKHNSRFPHPGSKEEDNNNNGMPDKRNHFASSNSGNTAPLGDSPAGQTLLYMLSGARTNSLLQVRIEVEPISGDTNFIVPEFTGPSINFSGEGGGEDEINGKASGFQTITGGPSRSKIRKLRSTVLTDLSNNETSKVSNSHNLDLLLMGKVERLQSDLPQEELEKYHIRHMGDNPQIVHLKEARPYEEIEIRDSFSTWGDYR